MAKGRALKVLGPKKENEPIKELEKALGTIKSPREPALVLLLLVKSLLLKYRWENVSGYI